MKWILIQNVHIYIKVLLLSKFGSESRDFNWCRFLASCVLGSSLISTCQILNIECLLLFSSGRRSWKNQNKYIFQIPNWWATKDIRYVLWCCDSICHEVFTFIQIGSGHTVAVQTRPLSKYLCMYFYTCNKKAIFLLFTRGAQKNFLHQFSSW